MSDSFTNEQFAMAEAQQAVAARDKVAAALRQRGVSPEFIEAYVPKTGDPAALRAGAQQAAQRFSEHTGREVPPDAETREARVKQLMLQGMTEGTARVAAAMKMPQRAGVPLV